LKPVAAWARTFDDPVLLPGGRELLTLRDAADDIMKLPKAEQDLEESQTATGCLIGAAEARDFVMHARIGVLRALNRNIERTLTENKARQSPPSDRRRRRSRLHDACAYRGVAGVEPPGSNGRFNPDRKDTHWGKRKLKRDQ